MFSFFKKPNTISVLFLIVLSFTFFYKFFLYRLISMPTDITVGLYYPWLDYQWGGLTTNVPVKNPLMSDIVSIIYQWRTLSINNLKNGIFPFWTNSYLSGVPLFANFQNSLVNFTNIFFFFIQNTGIAWTLMVLSQLVFLLLSTYFCLRNFKFKKISSIIGSIISSFSLFTVVWLEYGIHTYVAAFLPLFIICVEKYWQKKQIKFLVLLAFLIALQFYGGYPQYSIFSLVFIFLYFLFLSPKFSFKEISKFSFSIILGLILTLPLLVPGYQLISRSIRQFDTTVLQEETQGFLPLKNLFTLTIPNFFGNPATGDYFGQGNYDNNAVFPGSIAIIAFFTIFYLFLKHKTTKKINFFIFIIPISFLISIQNPISLFLKSNLGFIFSGNGISTRIFLLTNFSFSVLSAYFIDLILQKKIKNIFPIFTVFIWQIITITILVFQKNTASISFKNSLYSLFLSSIILGFIFLTIKWSRYSKFFLGLLLFSIIFEMFYYGLKYLPFSKSEYLFPTTPAIEYLQQNSEGYRVSTTNTIPANMWVPYELDSPDGYDTTMPLLNFKYISLLQQGDFDMPIKRTVTVDNWQSNLYQNLSIKYKFTLGNTPPVIHQNTGKNFESVYSDKNVMIEENHWVLPKIRFVDQVIFAADEEDFKNIYSEVDFSKTAILFSSDELDFADFDSNLLSTESNIEIVKDEDNYISFNTQNDQTKLVFISNSFYPGWQAYIDGQETKIYQTNYAFQSILAPAGEHQIILRYTPTYFKLCLILASVSAIILLGILIYDRKRK